MERDNGHPTVEEATSRMRDDFESLREAAMRRREELVGKLRRFIDDHPFAAVGIAFGVGYVLSGALLSRTTAKLLGVGVKAYLGPMLSSMVKGGLADVVGAGRGGGGA